MKDMIVSNPYRLDFPIFSNKKEPFVYLDSAATAHKPKVVIDEISSFMATEYATVHRAIYAPSQIATQKYIHARDLIAKFLSAETEEIIFTRGTTTALNFLARALEMLVKERQTILISAIEHHANFLPWVELAKRKNLKLLEVPYQDGIIDLNFVEEVCKKESVFMMSLPHISNVLGIEQPIAELSNILHQYGALLILDAAQSAPHIPLNVQKLGIDFLAFSGHKLYGPTGIGVLFGRAKLLEKLPPVEFGGDMVIDANLTQPIYQPIPLRFEAGTPSIIEVIGLAKAIEYLMQVDRSLAKTNEEKLIKKLGERLERMDDIHIIGPLHSKRCSLLTFTFTGLHPLDVATFLDAKGICVRSGHLCAQPALRYFKATSCMRASLGIYSDESDINTFADHLEEICKMLKGS